MSKTNAATKQAPAPAAASANTPATTGGDSNTTTTDGNAGEGAETPKPDPFANLPLCRVGETDNVIDFTGVATSNPRKYAKVHAEAVEGKLPVQKGWKHSAAVFIPGTNKGGENGFKPGSVYGTIADVAKRAGKSGIPAHELVAEVRKAQVGNKRSHFCDALPPVGWVEGWVNTAITKSIIGVHPTKKAPALVVAPKGDEATPAQNAEAKQLAAANG